MNDIFRRILFFSLVLGIFLSFTPVFAQDWQDDSDTAPAEKKGDFWICPSADMAMFSVSEFAYGGSLALGYGTGASIGLKASWFIETGGKLSSLELCFLMRVYFLGADSCSGPFIQLSAGPVLFAEDESLKIPSSLGIVSAGINFGWRFLLGSHLYLEPAIRGGYPYIVGIGVGIGYRF